MATSSPYCTVAQYEARYGTVQDEDQLYECLMDATRSLDMAIRQRGRDSEEFDPDLLMQACRQMAKRCAPADGSATSPWASRRPASLLDRTTSSSRWHRPTTRRR